MQVLVPIKRVIDPYVAIRVKSDGSGVETTHVKMATNPFDEIALEEAIRWREKGLIERVTAVSIGDDTVVETLRAGLALGADDAIHVEQADGLEPLGIAKILKALVAQHQSKLVILGKQSIDGDNNQVGQLLAGLLDWPQGTFVSAVRFVSDKQVEVDREVDGGLETLRLNLPAVLTTDLRLNEPRYPTLPNIMKAKQKPLTSMTVAELGVQLAPQLQIETIGPPGMRPAGTKVDSVQVLVDKLVNEAKVIG